MDNKHSIPDSASLDERYPRNRMELIRFATRADCCQAIGVLLERGMLNYSSSVPNEWAVWTDVVRVLRASGVPFEWLTENA